MATKFDTQVASKVTRPEQTVQARKALAHRTGVTRPLYGFSQVAIADVVCAAPRSGCGPERYAGASHMMIVRSGVFVRHGGRVLGRGVTANPGTVLFFNEGEPFRISHPTSRGDASTTIAFAPDIVCEVVREYDPTERGSHQHPYPLTHAVLAPSVLLELYRLRSTLRASAPATRTMEVEVQALGLLEKIIAGSYPNAKVGRKGDCARCRVRRRDIAEGVKEALAKSPFVATSLRDLATYMGLSPFHLARTFSEEVGVPIHQYLLRLRLAAALDRVSDPSVNLAAIALDVGFCSPSHFSSAFRKAFGTAPMALRAEAGLPSAGQSRRPA